RLRGDAKEELRTLEGLVGSKLASQQAPTPDELYALGRAYASNQRLDEARAQFDDALAQVPQHLPSLLGAGYVRYAQDDRDGAEGFFKR
ncbi:tetratricopeptide repeat protein, partial [Enterococcus faecium]